MESLSDYTDEEIGLMVREAARGQEFEAAEAIRAQGSFAQFLEEIGLSFLADLVRMAAKTVWEGIKSIFEDIFG